MKVIKYHQQIVENALKHKEEHLDFVIIDTAVVYIDEALMNSFKKLKKSLNQTKLCLLLMQ